MEHEKDIQAIYHSLGYSLGGVQHYRICGAPDCRICTALGCPVLDFVGMCNSGVPDSVAIGTQGISERKQGTLFPEHSFDYRKLCGVDRDDRCRKFSDADS